MPPGPAHRQGPAAAGPAESKPKVLFGKYEVGRLLGCGAFAKVYHARDLGHSGASVAIKCISKLRIMKANLVPNTEREVSIMRRLRHPHIVRIHEALATRSKIYFVMEFVKGGELFGRIATKGRMPEERSRNFFQQLVSAVGFCHSRGVFHRDLKPENLLLDEHGNLKVSDFGLSAGPEQVRPDGLFHTLCGTPAYVAPEVLVKRGYDGAKVDIWSCGVILFVLNAGYLPFNDSNLMHMYRKICHGEYRMPKWTSPELRRLISRLLDTNPATRITVEGIVNDPWFRKGMKEENVRRLMSFHTETEERMSKAEREAEPDRELNAFDIISLSSGFDLSGMFDGKTERARFVSDEPTDRIVEKVEEVGRREGLVVRRKKEKVGRGGVAVEGQNGNLVAWVEVYRLSPGLVMVEVEKWGEEEEEGRWNSEFWRERLGPASEPATPVCGGTMAGLAFAAGSASEPVSPTTAIGGVDSGSGQEF